MYSDFWKKSDEFNLSGVELICPECKLLLFTCSVENSLAKKSRRGVSGVAKAEKHSAKNAKSELYAAFVTYMTSLSRICIIPIRKFVEGFSFRMLSPKSGSGELLTIPNFEMF